VPANPGEETQAAFTPVRPRFDKAAAQSPFLQQNAFVSVGNIVRFHTTLVYAKKLSAPGFTQPASDQSPEALHARDAHRDP
jgi:hypothetical protein